MKLHLSKFLIAIVLLYATAMSDMSVKEAENLMKEIRRTHPTAAKALAGFIWDETIKKNDNDNDGKLNKEEMRKVYENMKAYDEKFIGDPLDSFENDFQLVDKLPADGFVTKKEILWAVKNGKGKALDDIFRIGFNEDVDVDPKDGMLNEKEILKFAPKLVEAASGEIRAHSFIELISNLVPQSMDTFFADLFKDSVLKKFDRRRYVVRQGWTELDGKLDQKEATLLLMEIVRAKIRNINAQSIFNAIDTNADGFMDSNEFSTYMVKFHQEKGMQGAIKTVQDGFVKKYDVSPKNFKLDQSEGSKFFEALNA